MKTYHGEAAVPIQREIATAARPKAPEVLTGIQLLRGFAAVFVVLTHVNLIMRYPRYFGASPLPLRDAGVFAVTVFFVISGFIIVLVSLDTNWRPRVSLPDFARKRALRIVPFMWLCTLGYTALVYAGTRSFDGAALLRTLVLWPVGELKPNILWSLVHEALFYCLFAASLKFRAAAILLCAWFVAPLVYASALLLTGGSVQPQSPDLAELLRVWLLGGFSGANLQFGAGFLLGLAWLKGAPWLRSAPVRAAVPLSALGAATVLVEIMHAPVAGWARLIGWTLLAALIVALGIRAQDDGRLARIGNVLGNASFAIYLTHNGTLLVLLELCRGVRDHVPGLLAFAVFSLVAVGVGLVVHHLVEAPLIGWMSGKTRVAPWQRFTARRQPALPGDEDETRGSSVARPADRR